MWGGIKLPNICRVWGGYIGGGVGCGGVGWGGGSQHNVLINQQELKHKARNLRIPPSCLGQIG